MLQLAFLQEYKAQFFPLGLNQNRSASKRVLRSTKGAVALRYFRQCGG